MSSEEPTRDARIRRIIDEEITLPQTGIITRVREHQSEDDVWNYHVDVRISEENHPRKVPVATAIPEMIASPRSTAHPDGPDLALVQYLDDDESERPIVTNILFNRQDRAPKGDEGVLRIRRSNLYVEMAEDGSHARLSKKSNDDVTPDLVVEIDDSGRVTIGDPNGDLQPVARKGDEVQVPLSDGSTGTGSITEGSSDVDSS